MSKLTFWRRSEPDDTLGQASAKIQNGAIDHAIVALGSLTLLGWLPVDVTSVRIQISSDAQRLHHCSVDLVRYQRPDVAQAFRLAGIATPYKTGFLTRIELPIELRELFKELAETKQQVSISFEVAGVSRWSFKCIPLTLRSAMEGKHITTEALKLMSQLPMAASAISRVILASFANDRTARQPLPAHIDSAFTCEQGPLVMAGWVADADRGSLYALDSQLCDEPLKLAVSTFPRADVSTHLRSSSEPVVSDRHGFVSVATSVLGDAIYICRHDDAQVRLSPVFNLTRQELSKSDFFGRLRQHAIEIGDNTTAALTAFLQEIKLEKFSKRAEVSRVVEFGPRRTDTCDVSIIVPFFGDSFYLLDHIAAQSRAPNSVEWIFVCDDPRLVGTLIETLRCRSDALMQRTKLVILAANFGFAEANNAAIGFADGKYLLLMNSDVYCEKFDFLNYAIGEFEQHQTVGCIGFSLQFEDGTIQHDGMTFERAIWMDGLWVCEHKNKGMPQNWEIPVCESADAVTAALMLLRRSDLTGEELFDRSYVVGDFEDADLCMRLRERGKSIRIVRTSGLFHLERQSLRLVGDASSRNSLTHVNCITFNRRWAGQLAENWI